MKIIGITGGSGAGKSIVAAIWEGMGARLINADRVYHRLLDECSPMQDEISARYPQALRQGKVDRALLRGVVFGDAQALADLGRITHPYVIEEIRRELERARADGVSVAVVEALFLLENELAQNCDLTVAVVAPMDMRLRRIMVRDGLDEETAWERLHSQQWNEFYFQNCDRVIENTGSSAELTAKAESLFNSIINS